MSFERGELFAAAVCHNHAFLIAQDVPHFAGACYEQSLPDGVDLIVGFALVKHFKCLSKLLISEVSLLRLSFEAIEDS